MGVLEMAVNAPGRGVRNTGGLVIKPRYASHNRPEFQAKFRVAEEEPDGPFQRVVDSVNTNAAVYNPAVAMIPNRTEIAEVAI